MPETAGSVTIQITANTTAFEAALARAKEQATAFDAQVSAKLSGAGVSEGLAKIAAGVEQTNALLAKLTTSGSSAGVALAKVAASTKATTAALTDVAAATKLANAEIASIGGSGGGAAALTTGTIAAKDFAAALEATGGNLSKITPGMLGLAVANEEVAVSSKAAAVGMAELGVAETKAAGLGAGVSREFSVLGGEVLRGNFSRIPGSLLVMNERLASTGAGVLTLGNGMKALGALGEVVFNPFVLGFLAITVGSEVAIRAFKSIGGSVEDVNTILENHKKLVDEITGAYPEAAAAAKKYEEIAKQLPQSVVASDSIDRIKADQAALDKSMGGILNTLRLAQAASDVVGTAGADAFGHLADEIQAGSIHADELARNLVGLTINPALNDTAQAIAQDLKGAAKEALGLENILIADKGLKSVGPDGQKARQTLFDVSTGFKEVKTSAGSADATISKLFGTLNSGGDARFGVTRSITDQFGSQFTSQLQGTLGMFQTVDQAVQQARQDQLASMLQLQSQFHATTTEVDVLKQALATAGGKDNIRDFFGDVANIANANAEIQNSVTTVQKLFAAMATGNTSVNAVSQGLEMVRQTLINDGFPTVKVDAFLNRLVEANRQLVADQGQVHQLGAAINALHDKTISITVQTRQVGSGIQSSYQVPTTYGGAESAGTGSSYGVTGSSTVNVTRFGGTRAAGGPMSSGLPYWVGEHGPELVVPSSAGSVIPNAQSMALANPQSAFTGRDPTKENDRFWTVLMNIEANTRKTEQLLEEIKTSGGFSGSSGGGSSSGSAGTMTRVGSDLYDSNGLDAGGHTAAQVAVYRDILNSAMANYSAIGGMGLVGYNSNGLAATPQQIAANIAYNGASSVGTPGGGSSIGSAPTALRGGDPYNAMLNGISPSSPGYAQAYAQALAASNKAHGFDTGGMIGGGPGDTQKVEFFKNPNEKVIIARPDQFADVRPGSSNTGSAGTNDNRPIQIHQYNNWYGNTPPAKDSLAEVRRQTALGTRDALGSVYGR